MSDIHIKPSNKLTLPTLCNQDFTSFVDDQISAWSQEASLVNKAVFAQNSIQLKLDKPKR